MKLKILYLMLIFAVSIMFTVNSAFAEIPIIELNKLTDKCKEYEKEVKKSNIADHFPEFNKNKKISIGSVSINGNEYKYKYIVKEKAELKEESFIVREYDFKDVNVRAIYENLRNIVNKAENKKIALRKVMPAENAEDSVKLTTSLSKENNGYTCYIKKSDTEYWIKTEPDKSKKAEFILVAGKNGESSKLYYRENILP